MLGIALQLQFNTDSHSLFLLLFLCRFPKLHECKVRVCLFLTTRPQALRKQQTGQALLKNKNEWMAQKCKPERAGDHLSVFLPVSDLPYMWPVMILKHSLSQNAPLVQELLGECPKTWLMQSEIPGYNSIKGQGFGHCQVSICKSCWWN